MVCKFSSGPRVLAFFFFCTLLTLVPMGFANTKERKLCTYTNAHTYMYEKFHPLLLNYLPFSTFNPLFICSGHVELVSTRDHLSFLLLFLFVPSFSFLTLWGGHPSLSTPYYIFFFFLSFYSSFVLFGTFFFCIPKCTIILSLHGCCT